MRLKICLYLAVAVLVGFLAWAWLPVDLGDGIAPMVEASEAESTDPVTAEMQGPTIPANYRIERFEELFPRQSNLRDVLVQHDFTPQDIHQLLTDTQDVYNLNRVTAGHRYALERYGDGRFRQLEYDIDDESYLLVGYGQGRYEAEVKKREFETSVATLYGRITDSLWNTLLTQGEGPQLIMAIYEVMQWDIDFTAIQQNDAFKLIFEKRYYQGEFVKYGEVIALEFEHGGRKFYAFQFTDPASGKRKYYDFEGKGVKKAFLKVPFKYDYRISSGFSYSRLHPVSKVRRPHYGVDYAAPTGTPVLASASGRVVFAGWKGANGKLVKIRHTNGYTTFYLHLSKILVKSGQSVGQGDRIGLVGATGTATGPHLDYRIQDKRGTFINPKKWVALPSDTGVAKKDLDSFNQVRDELMKQLESIPERPATDTGLIVAG